MNEKLGEKMSNKKKPEKKVVNRECLWNVKASLGQRTKNTQLVA